MHDHRTAAGERLHHRVGDGVAGRGAQAADLCGQHQRGRRIGSHGRVRRRVEGDGGGDALRAERLRRVDGHALRIQGVQLEARDLDARIRARLLRGDVHGGEAAALQAVHRVAVRLEQVLVHALGGEDLEQTERLCGGLVAAVLRRGRGAGRTAAAGLHLDRVEAGHAHLEGVAAASDGVLGRGGCAGKCGARCAKDVPAQRLRVAALFAEHVRAALHAHLRGDFAQADRLLLLKAAVAGMLAIAVEEARARVLHVGDFHAQLGDAPAHQRHRVDERSLAARLDHHAIGGDEEAALREHVRVVDGVGTRREDGAPRGLEESVDLVARDAAKATGGAALGAHHPACGAGCARIREVGVDL
mmetsp:Transcript_6363/g.25697  ORF Transcript_6363/g.25697 Transcript_6363/m.25697 type:complete len:359 (+) Transcript_6363:1955-3031(+)